MEYDSRTLRPLAGVVLVIAGAYALRALTRSLFTPVLGGTGRIPGWLPQFGTIGQTVTTYLLVVSLVSYVLVPLLTFALGYRFGERSAS